MVFGGLFVGWGNKQGAVRLNWCQISFGKPDPHGVMQVEWELPRFTLVDIIYTSMIRNIAYGQACTSPRFVFGGRVENALDDAQWREKGAAIWTRRGSVWKGVIRTASFSHPALSSCRWGISFQPSPEFALVILFVIVGLPKSRHHSLRPRRSSLETSAARLQLLAKCEKGSSTGRASGRLSRCGNSQLYRYRVGRHLPFPQPLD